MEKPIFSCNVDISKNAYLNWRTSKEDIPRDLFVLGESFADAAIILMNRILEDNSDKKADSIVLPILYNIDQSVELYLKAIIREIETLLGDNISNYVKHDIKKLLNTMRGLIAKKDIKTKGLEACIQPLESYIDELYQKIATFDNKGKEKANMDFARYPIDTDGNLHFYVAEIENVVVDIENLQSRYMQIKDCLEGIFLKYESELENI